MNSVIRTIRARRSVRHYTSQQIPQRDLENALQTALYAPSSKGLQAWHICVVQNKEVLDALDEAVKRATKEPGYTQYLDMVSKEDYCLYLGAPTFVIVSGNPAVSTTPECDCSLLLGYLFLAAASMGIASTWVHQLVPVQTQSEVQQLLTWLGVPPGNLVCGCACLGYRAETETFRIPRRPEVITYV